MTTIDHRILIPVPQPVVWDYIRKLTNNPRWQIDSRNLSVLTSKAEGVGTRWRETHASGRDFVAEITAWYDGLGYQYLYVERPPFKRAVGTLRLQEIAEGTIVQWTLEYELSGVLSGMRNALGTSRQIDAAIQGSLKKLYLQLKTDRARTLEPGIETKALIRDAPDAESRAQYKARHPSSVQMSETPPNPPVSSGGPVIFEPALNQEDTRPTRATAAITDEQIAAYTASAEPGKLEEPDFIASLPPSTDDTSPLRDVMGNAQPIDTDAVRRELVGNIASSSALEGSNAADPAPPTRSRAEVEAAEQTPARQTAEIQRLGQDASSESGAAGFAIPEPTPSDSQRLMDTSNMSIWEVFGVPRPSETGEHQKVVVEAPEEQVEKSPQIKVAKTTTKKKASSSEASMPPPTATKTATAAETIPQFDSDSIAPRGLRQQMRAQRVRLRRHR
jgi:hypothetical protein